MKDWLIDKLGGYKNFNSVLKGLDEEERTQVLTLAVEKLFTNIGPKDILREKNGQWTYQGKPMIEAHKQLLIADAQQFQTTKLWKILSDDIRFQANYLMFVRSKTEMDIVAGKLWLRTLDSIDEKLKKIARGTLKDG